MWSGVGQSLILWREREREREREEEREREREKTLALESISYTCMSSSSTFQLLVLGDSGSQQHNSILKERERELHVCVHERDTVISLLNFFSVSCEVTNIFYTKIVDENIIIRIFNFANEINTNNGTPFILKTKNLSQ